MPTAARSQAHSTPRHSAAPTATKPSSQEAFKNKFSIDEPVAITFMLSSETVDCSNFNKTIHVDNLKGGTAPYNFIWSGPSRVVTAPNGDATMLSKGGQYSLTVSDANGCEVSKTYDLIEDFYVTPLITNVSCAGDAQASAADANRTQATSSNDGKISVSVDGATSVSYNWLMLRKKADSDADNKKVLHEDPANPGHFDVNDNDPNEHYEVN